MKGDRMKKKPTQRTQSSKKKNKTVKPKSTENSKNYLRKFMKSYQERKTINPEEKLLRWAIAGDMAFEADDEAKKLKIEINRLRKQIAGIYSGKKRREKQAFRFPWQAINELGLEIANDKRHLFPSRIAELVRDRLKKSRVKDIPCSKSIRIHLKPILPKRIPK